MGRGDLIKLCGGELLTIICTSKENSTFSVMHSRLKSGTSRQINYHEHDTEAFYVLSGRVRFIAGSESQYVREAQSGTIIVCPPYCNRGYQAITDSIMIIINYPSGPTEGFIRDYASSIDSTTTTTSSSTTPPIARDAIKRFQTRYGVHIQKAYNVVDIRPKVADLGKDGPITVGELCFSHGGNDDDDDDDDENNKGGGRTLWLYACDTNDKSPHSLPVTSKTKTGPEVFCVGRA